MDKKFAEFVSWGFQSLLLAFVAWGVSELAGVNKSIQELNIKMAVVITKSEGYEVRIQKLEEARPWGLKANE